MLDRIKKLISEYQEVAIWLPLVFFGVWVAFKGLPQIDPRSGLDGFGQIMAMLVNVCGGVLATFFAWLTKRTYFGVHETEDRMAMTPIARLVDFAEWVACLLVWFLAVFF